MSRHRKCYLQINKNQIDTKYDFRFSKMPYLDIIGPLITYACCVSTKSLRTCRTRQTHDTSLCWIIQRNHKLEFRCWIKYYRMCLFKWSLSNRLVVDAVTVSALQSKEFQEIWISTRRISVVGVAKFKWFRPPKMYSNFRTIFSKTASCFTAYALFLIYYEFQNIITKLAKHKKNHWESYWKFNIDRYASVEQSTTSGDSVLSTFSVANLMNIQMNGNFYLREILFSWLGIILLVILGKNLIRKTIVSFDCCVPFVHFCVEFIFSAFGSRM